MERVTGIGGIFFKARDPGQMMTWYAKHLGLPATGAEETNAMFTWRDPADPALEGSTVWALFPHDTGYFGPGSAPFMVNFRVADLDALLAQLCAEGVTAEARIEEYVYGRFAWITDPEGNRIELWEPPQGTAGRDVGRIIRMDSLVASCKESAVQGMEYFLRNFSFVPDDKLTWTPTPTAKSAIRIAAHTALYAGRFAGMIRDGKLPGRDNLAEWLAQRNAEEAALTSRTEMESSFRKGTAEVIAALESLTPEAIGATLDSGLGWSMPMTSLMNKPGWHATLHAGQIDYLQTCWGDQEVHF